MPAPALGLLALFFDPDGATAPDSQPGRAVGHWWLVQSAISSATSTGWGAGEQGGNTGCTTYELKY